MNPAIPAGVAGLLIGAMWVNSYLAVLPMSVVAGTAVCIAIVAALLRRSELLRGQGVRAVMAFLMVAAIQGIPDGFDAYRLAGVLSPACVAFAAMLMAPADGPHIDHPPRDRLTRAHVAFFAALAAVGALLHQQFVWPWVGGIIDENLYVMQGRLLATGNVSTPIEAGLQPFIQLRQTAVVDGRLFTQYPPGWPALIAAASWIGLVPALPWALTALNTVLVHRLAVATAGHDVARVAVGMFAVHNVVISSGGGFFAHTAVMTAVLLAAIMLVARPPAPALIASRDALVAGLALGVAILIRPLTGVAIGLSIVLWRWLREKRNSIVRSDAFIGLGVAGPVLLLLLYNHATTGDALTLGYAAANGELHDLGFGTRGLVVRHPDMSAWHTHYGPLTAITSLLQRLRDALTFALLPAGLTVFLVSAAWPLAQPAYSVKVVAAFLALPLVYALYFWQDLRFSLDVLPFFCIGMALLLVRAFTGAKQRRYYVMLVISALAATSVAAIVINAGRLAQLRNAVMELHSMQRRFSQLLVFVRAQPNSHGGEPLLEALSPAYVPSAESSLVVARDLGSRNHLLTSRFPAHVVVYATWHGPKAPVSWELSR